MQARFSRLVPTPDSASVRIPHEVATTKHTIDERQVVGQEGTSGKSTIDNGAPATVGGERQLYRLSAARSIQLSWHSCLREPTNRPVRQGGNQNSG